MSLKKNNFLYDLNKLFEKYNIDWFEAGKNLTLSWDEVLELSRDELVTIGNHTMNHLAFSQLSEKEIIQEVLEANRVIENKIHKKIEHFAYPFGCEDTITKRECDIIKKLNFKTATSTRSGNIFLPHRNYFECLPRIYLGENFRIENLKQFRKKRVITL